MYDVYFYEAFEEERDALIHYAPKTLHVGYTHKTIQEENHAEPPAPIISIRTQSQLPPAWASSIKAILSRSAGYDHLTAYQCQTSSAIHCGYLPRYCARAVAEQAMLLWTALLRQLPRQIRQFDSFHRDGITGSECLGKNLLVAGVGHIGKQIADLALALGMNVLAVDPVERHPDLHYFSFTDALPRADLIVCSMNLTNTNADFFSYDRLAGAKPGALFINIARGELAPPADLLRLLREGILGGIALDVYPEEQQLAVRLRARQGFGDTSSQRALAELRNDDRVILTPHNAFNTREAVDRKASQSIEQLHHFFQHGNFLWPIPD